MSADLLRRAARLMRERAEAATPGPWKASRVDSPRSQSTSAVYSGALPPGSEVVGSTHRRGGIWRGADATHIASWHPTVALAVADWLDEEASLDVLGVQWGKNHPAVALARAYLGEPA